MDNWIAFAGGLVLSFIMGRRRKKKDSRRKKEIFDTDYKEMPDED